MVLVVEVGDILVLPLVVQEHLVKVMLVEEMLVYLILVVVREVVVVPVLLVLMPLHVLPILGRRLVFGVHPLHLTYLIRSIKFTRTPVH